jgi:hypothetical protein
MPQRPTRSLIFALCCIAIAACDRGQGEPAPARAARPDSASGDVAQYALMKNNIGWLTDSNIVALATQLNSSAQQTAELETQAWTSEPMRAFSTDVVRDHGRLRFAIDSLVSLKRLPAQMPAVGPSMQAPYDSMRVAQTAMPLEERERQFLDLLIAEHARSITDFGALAGNASDPDLRALLANRGVLMEQTHVSRAKLLKAAITRADSVKQDSLKNAKARGRTR